MRRAVVVLAAHALETPRLLLLSANATFPDGLANSSGLVGRRFMSHPTWQVFGTFDEPINAFKGMQMGHVMVQDYYRPDRRRGYARGFVLLSYMMTPITYATLSGSFFGAELKEFLHDYAHTAAWWAHAEGLPHERQRRDARSRGQDARGLPVARLTYAWGENDVALAAAARDKAGEMMAASGARSVRVGLNYAAHAMGSCRMGDDPRIVRRRPLLPVARRPESLRLRHERLRHGFGRESDAHGDGDREPCGRRDLGTGPPRRAVRGDVG